MQIFLIVLASCSLIEIADYKTRHREELPVVVIAEEQTPSEYPYSTKYEFTTNWFSQHIPIWKIALKDYTGMPSINYLEVGVYEGASALWVLENVLTGPNSKLTVIDPFFEEYQRHSSLYEQRFRNNLKKSLNENKATVIKGYSQIELRKLPLESFDIVYIDGSHKNADVLEDAILSLRLLTPDGITIFDDYLKNDPTMGAPKQAINIFMQCIKANYK